MAYHKTFRDYVSEQETTFPVRIKSVVPLDDAQMPYIERVLARYMLLDISAPIKTMMQKHPLDFYNVQNAEVWIVDAIVRLPISAYVLRQELKLALNISENFIIVRSPNDPLEIETARLNALEEIDAEADEKKLKPGSRLSTNSDYDIDERGELENPAFGNEYNEKFLEVLADVATKREKFVIDPDDNSLNKDAGTIADAEKIEDGNAFNKGIDVPQPKSSNYAETLKNLRKENKLGSSRLSTNGNYDDDEVKQTSKFDKYGEAEKVATVTITNKRGGVRKN
jgi:hypothetical protein